MTGLFPVLAAPKALRPHQTAGLGLLRESFRSGHRRPLLQIATGGGKTVVAANIIRGVVDNGGTVVFTAPALSLIDQTVAAFRSEGIDRIGVMQADHPETDCSQPVQVASVATLVRRPRLNPTLVIVDEAHRRNDRLNAWLGSLECRAVGLSATPWSKGLGLVWDDLIVAATTADLIDAGFLSPFRVFAPSKPDLAGVRTRMGDYREDDLSDAMNKPKLVADIVSTWLEKGEGRPTLCFCVDRAHARNVEGAFLSAGVRCGYIDGDTPREERLAVAKRFRDGDLQVVANVGVLTTGVDWDVRCLILARPTKSEILYTQIIGRALRTAPGKPDALILDHSDTTARLGFVTELHHETLCDGSADSSVSKKLKEERERLAECPKCSFMRERGRRDCPSCGFVPVPKTRVETVAGELVEFGAGQRAAVDQAERRRFYAELRRYFLNRGKKEGAAFYAFQEKFGVKPPYAWRNDPPADDVSGSVASYMTSRLIAFAKSRERSGETSGRAAA